MRTASTSRTKTRFWYAHCGTVLWDTGTFLYIDGYDVVRLDLETGDTELIYTYDAPYIDQGTELFSLNNDYLALMVNGGCNPPVRQRRFNYLSENELDSDGLIGAMDPIPVADGYIFHFWAIIFDERAFFARIVDNELVIEDDFGLEPQMSCSQFENPVILNDTQFLYENDMMNRILLRGIENNEIDLGGELPRWQDRRRNGGGRCCLRYAGLVA